MSSKIHHNTAKKAKKHGLTIKSVENEFEVHGMTGGLLAMHASASVALDRAIAKINDGLKPVATPEPKKAKPARKPRDEDEDEGDELEDEPEEGNSVVKHKYKQVYKGRPLKISCSDDLAVQIARHLKVKDEDGKLRIDPVKLQAFARANNVWDPKYSHLNVGMRRMNVVNRLRAKIRRDNHKVVWG